jgi:hypothetical protein
MAIKFRMDSKRKVERGFVNKKGTSEIREAWGEIRLYNKLCEIKSNWNLIRKKKKFGGERKHERIPKQTDSNRGIMHWRRNWKRVD